tara:strand:- start:86 stop:889 length:804 start_codon:yes stop_codon:yes gene_type:complete
MKYLIIILTLILFTTCSQNKTREKVNNKLLPDRIVYVENPNDKDTLCISEIDRAKEDIAKGKIVFTQSFGFGTSELRYENELRQICKEYGLMFDVDLIGCVVFEGQTQGCYGDYMDKIIFEKFGIDFKENIHRQADSLFLKNADLNNKVVQYWDCDERPKLPSENKRISDYLTTFKVKDVNIEKDESEYGGWPFFDLGFIVEKDSTINGFYISNYVAHLDKNEKFKSKLFEIAIDHIKESYPVWIPGKIKGVSVRTDNNVRIFFEKD